MWLATIEQKRCSRVHRVELSSSRVGHFSDAGIITSKACLGGTTVARAEEAYAGITGAGYWQRGISGGIDTAAAGSIGRPGGVY